MKKALVLLASLLFVFSTFAPSTNAATKTSSKSKKLAIGKEVPKTVRGEVEKDLKSYFLASQLANLEGVKKAVTADYLKARGGEQGLSTHLQEFRKSGGQYFYRILKVHYGKKTNELYALCLQKSMRGAGTTERQQWFKMSKSGAHYLIADIQEEPR